MVADVYVLFRVTNVGTYIFEGVYGSVDAAITRAKKLPESYGYGLCDRTEIQKHKVEIP